MIALVITLTLSLGFSSAYSVKENRYRFARQMRLDSGDNINVYNFETLTGQGINDCIESCKAKKLCKFINFDRLAKLCFLIGVRDNDENLSMDYYVEKKPGFYFWAKQEDDFCDGCEKFGVCSNSNCQNSGCEPPPEINNAKWKGNLYSVGDSVRYECKDGYLTEQTIPVISTCLENGSWSFVSMRCLHGCKPPPKMEYAIRKQKIYSVGDTVRYECKDGNKTAQTIPVKTTCLENGSWSFVSIRCWPAEFLLEVRTSNGKSYLLIRHDLNWDDANETCAQMNGQLVNIRSQEEQTYIESIIDKNVNNYYWTGGRRYPDDVFKLLDGTPLNYSNWKYGQPDSSLGEEDCVHMVKYWGYKWNDWSCANKCHAICEFT